MGHHNTSTPDDSPPSVSTATAPSPPLFEEVKLGEEVFQVSANNTVAANSPVEMRRTETSGLGLFATRKILPGHVLLVERPIIVMPDKIYHSTNMNKIGRWLEKTVSKLSETEQNCFYSLTDCGGRMSSHHGTFFTNDMNYGGEAGLFPVMARANHSCCPNADFVSRTDLGVQLLVATAAIAAGEEVFISYLPQCEEGSDVRKVRQNYLKTYYGFRCTCAVCAMKGYSLAQNDSIRRDIRDQQEDEDVKLKFQSVEDLTNLVDRLHHIGGKLPYILQIHEIIYKKAVKKEDWALAIKEGVSGWNIALAMFGHQSPQEELWRQRSLIKLVKVEDGDDIFEVRTFD